METGSIATFCPKSNIKKLHDGVSIENIITYETTNIFQHQIWFLFSHLLDGLMKVQNILIDWKMQCIIQILCLAHGMEISLLVY